MEEVGTEGGETERMTRLNQMKSICTYAVLANLQTSCPEILPVHQSPLLGLRVSQHSTDFPGLSLTQVE